MICAVLCGHTEGHYAKYPYEKSHNTPVILCVITQSVGIRCHVTECRHAECRYASNSLSPPVLTTRKHNEQIPPAPRELCKTSFQKTKQNKNNELSFTFPW